MKLQSLALSSLLTAAILGGCASTEPAASDTESGDWLTFDGDSYTIEYPSNWELDDSGAYGAPFFLFTEQESREDQFRENINILSEDLAGMEITLSEYTDLSLVQIAAGFEGYELLERKEVEGENGDYTMVIYKAEQEDLAMHLEQRLFVKDDTAYVLTFTALEDSFGTFQKEAEAILDTFQVE